MGNQLFQIAATIALALRNNDKYVFPHWEYEPYFSLAPDCFSNHIEDTYTYQEPHFHYTPIPYSPNMSLSGFYQSERYFKDYENLIRSLLTPKIGFGIKYGCASIHVRRGDYTKLTREYEQLRMDYYKRAMDIVGAEQYIVVSDDIAWCKANFSGDNIAFSEGKMAVEDLAMQISCEHCIIANSSFSWWGAWLNANPNKKVVAPKKWFGDALPHDTKDLLPEEWIKA